jgi:hypothetical protein
MFRYSVRKGGTEEGENIQKEARELMEKGSG